jgi:hypothetical protein
VHDDALRHKLQQPVRTAGGQGGPGGAQFLCDIFTALHHHQLFQSSHSINATALQVSHGFVSFAVLLFGHTLGPRVSFLLHCADFASAVCDPTHLPDATHHTHCGFSPPYIRQPSHVLSSLQPAQELKAAASPDRGHSLGPWLYQELHGWSLAWQ